MSTPLLTKRQSEIFEFIEDRIMHGLPPTVREIGAKFGIRSPNGVMCHLKALEKKGLITRGNQLSRAITLVNNPYDKLKTQFDNLRTKCVELTKRHVKGRKLDPIINDINELVSS